MTGLQAIAWLLLVVGVFCVGHVLGYQDCQSPGWMLERPK